MKHYCTIISMTSFVIISSLFTVSAQVPAGKVDIVAVTGCVVEKKSGKWVLTAATDPEPSIANGPPSDEPFEGPMNGKNTFDIIGFSEFGLPALKNKTVLIKALFIEATPVSRLNLTSVTEVAPACTPSEK
jgi:hypothetical protein